MGEEPCQTGGAWVRMLLRAQMLTEAAGSVGHDMVDVTYWQQIGANEMFAFPVCMV